MILDKIENANLYYGLNERINKALDYIKNTDFLNASEGKYELDGENIYSLINIYDTKDKKGSFLEAHRKYIDVQYVVSGVEMFGHSLMKNQKPHTPYNEEKDFELFDEECSLIKFETGMFAIFFPEDLHTPGIKNNISSTVKKVVIKVLI